MKHENLVASCDLLANDLVKARSEIERLRVALREAENWGQDLRIQRAELLTTLRAIASISVNLPEAFEAAFIMCQKHARRALDEEEQQP